MATEEETWPDHTAEETESGIVENDPVRPLREGEYWVGTRYEEYGADGNLRFVYESEYDYEGRKTLEYCYDIQGQLYAGRSISTATAIARAMTATLPPVLPPAILI